MNTQFQFEAGQQDGKRLMKARVLESIRSWVDWHQLRISKSQTVGEQNGYYDGLQALETLEHEIVKDGYGV